MKLSIITPSHDLRWLPELVASLQSQIDPPAWEFVLCLNHTTGDETALAVLQQKATEITADISPNTVILIDPRPYTGVGDRKRFAFGQATGDVFIELDHDDLLLPEALQEIAEGFRDPLVGFVYSDWIDFEDTPKLDHQGDITYRRPDTRPGWLGNGFTFYPTTVGGVRAGNYEAGRAFPPTAASCSLIFWAPNHVRAWRADTYREAGGHNDLELCDDHDLVCRTFKIAKFHHVTKPLYMYRVSPSNTWLKNVEKIAVMTRDVRNMQLEGMVLREGKQHALPCYDLGAALSPREGWTPVDAHESVLKLPGGIQADLGGRWPFADNSVFAFRACDLLEHLPDKINTMREIWRCLVPGGWLLSLTPSTSGMGAFMDPTHVSFWNIGAFWYFTRAEQAQYIRNTEIRFQEHDLRELFPGAWHRENNIPYVSALLVALKPGYVPCGEVKI